MIWYNPSDWFWIVGGDESRAWSSAAGAYVGVWDQALGGAEPNSALAALKIKSCSSGVLLMEPA